MVNRLGWKCTLWNNGGGRHLRLGGGEQFVCVPCHISMACVSTHMLWGVGVCSPRKILQIRCSEIASEATFGPKRHYSYHCCLYVFACMTLFSSGRCWRVQTSVSSAEYYIGLLSLGRGHNVARFDTHALGSLRHAARLETSWLGHEPPPSQVFINCYLNCSLLYV